MLVIVSVLLRQTSKREITLFKQYNLGFKCITELKIPIWENFECIHPTEIIKIKG